MKLYTEESLKCAFDKARAVNNDDYGDYTYDSFDEIKYDGELKPIELPSDEEIDEASPYVPQDAHDYYFGNKEGFKDGAKWMKEQIENQNK